MGTSRRGLFGLFGGTVVASAIPQKSVAKPEQSLGYAPNVQSKQSTAKVPSHSPIEDHIPATADFHPVTVAEGDAGFTGAEMSLKYEPGDVRRYLITPNSTASRASNTAALKKLISNGGTSAFKGRLSFTNTTGADIYYLGDIIDCKDGISIDLCGSTLHFTKAAVKSDVNVGFITAIRDFSIENGSIVVDYNAGGIANRGNALMFGWRDNATYYANSYDSLLSSPMGNITVRNLRITQNTALSNAVLMFSGLCGVLFENVWIDGKNTLAQAIQYEFGWATNESNRQNRKTSHLSNAVFRNIKIHNCTGVAMQFTGAYNLEIDNLIVDNATSSLIITCGEALFYRPWLGADQVGAKRNVRLHNIVAMNPSGTAIVLTGAQKSAGYLSPLALEAKDESDLLDVSLESFSIVGAGGNGVHCSAGKAAIRNGYMRRCDRGIVLTHECTQFAIDGVTILDSASIGIQLDQDASLWNPARKKVGSIRNSFIAGSGASGAQSAVVVGMCESVLIENNRLGYEIGHDGVAEVTQSNAVNVQAGGSGVVCRGNYVGGTSGGAVAYNLANAPNGSRDCAIEDALGVTTYSGLWDGVVQTKTIGLTAVTPGDLSTTYGLRTFSYIKRGRNIDYTFQIETSAFTHTTASGTLRITSLPYTVDSGHGRAQGALVSSGIIKANYTQYMVEAIPGQQYLQITCSGPGQALSDLAITDCPSGGLVVLRGTGRYLAA